MESHNGLGCQGPLTSLRTWRGAEDQRGLCSPPGPHSWSRESLLEVRSLPAPAVNWDPRWTPMMGRGLRGSGEKPLEWSPSSVTTGLAPSLLRAGREGKMPSGVSLERAFTSTGILLQAAQRWCDSCLAPGWKGRAGSGAAPPQPGPQCRHGTKSLSPLGNVL